MSQRWAGMAAATLVMMFGSIGLATPWNGEQAGEDSWYESGAIAEPPRGQWVQTDDAYDPAEPAEDEDSVAPGDDDYEYDDEGYDPPSEPDDDSYEEEMPAEDWHDEGEPDDLPEDES